MVINSTLDFAIRRSWLLLPSVAAGAGAGYALDGLSPVMAGGAALGLAPALAAGLGLELRGHKLSTPEDVQRRHSLKTLGAIRRFQQAPGTAFPTDDFPDALQAYRGLAASLHGSGGRELRAILVTSAGPEEGKSTTAANLATVLAQLGNKVVLVDADLRWSSLRSTNASATSLGLSGLLLNYLHSPQLAVVRTNEHNLFLLPAGVLPPNPQELLALPRLRDIIASLREMADYVIFDSPPVLEAEDARLLAANVDATLLVMHAGKTRSRAVNSALRVLSEADARPLGAVLNQMKAPKPVVAPAAKRLETSAEAVAPAPQAVPGPAFDPYTIEAFRKGPPKPVSASAPLPPEPQVQPAIMRLAEEGLGSALPPPPARQGDFESAGYRQRLDALRNLRIVQPDERPLSPPTNEWAPVQPPSPPIEAPVEAQIPSRPLTPVEPVKAVEVTQPVVAPPAPVAAIPAVSPDISVEDVLAHMEETLRLIREMRQEKSASHS